MAIYAGGEKELNIDQLKIDYPQVMEIAVREAGMPVYEESTAISLVWRGDIWQVLFYQWDEQTEQKNTVVVEIDAKKGTVINRKVP